MKKLLWLTVLLAIPYCSIAQEKKDFKLLLLSPYYSKPHSRTDMVWSFSKPLGFAAAEADAYTTAREIKRGYVESNPLDNMIIPKDQPAIWSRSALLSGEAYGINLILQYAYGKCGTSKLCKWTVIGARGYFTGMSVANAVHNTTLP